MQQVLQGGAQRVRCPPQGVIQSWCSSSLTHLGLSTNQGVAVKKYEGFLLKVNSRPSHLWKTHSDMMKLLTIHLNNTCWFIHSKNTNLCEAGPGAANNPWWGLSSSYHNQCDNHSWAFSCRAEGVKQAYNLLFNGTPLLFVCQQTKFNEHRSWHSDGGV